MNHFKELIETCNQDIRVGQAQLVARRLAGVNISRIPRRWRAPLARVCRRARLISIGLKILTSVVFPDRHTADNQPTGDELAEYAMLLLRSGSTSEALQTIARVDDTKVPEARLYKAFCHFNRAEFEAAIPSIERYLRGSVDPYERLVGEVNLGAALTWADRYDEAATVLNLAISKTRIEGYRLLQANCHELLTQIHFYRGELAHAREQIGHAIELMGATTSASLFYAKRWKSAIDSFETNDITPLLNFRAEVIANNEWESVRQTDFLLLRVDFNRARFHHLIFGTPYEAFRQRAFDYLGEKPNADTYVLGKESSLCLDLRTAEIDGEYALNPGKKCHQLIDVLARDFYSPWRVAGIFAELFPDEHYNVYSSPDRVHQLIRRTRRWLESHSLAMEITEHAGGYMLRVTGPFSIRVPLQREPVRTSQMTLEKLRIHFSEKPDFSAREACEKLSLPKSSFQVFAKWALDSGQLIRSGTRNFTRYRFANIKTTVRAA